MRAATRRACWATKRRNGWPTSRRCGPGRKARPPMRDLYLLEYRRRAGESPIIVAPFSEQTAWATWGELAAQLTGTDGAWATLRRNGEVVAAFGEVHLASSSARMALFTREDSNG